MYDPKKLQEAEEAYMQLKQKHQEMCMKLEEILKLKGKNPKQYEEKIAPMLKKNAKAYHKVNGDYLSARDNITKMRDEKNKSLIDGDIPEIEMEELEEINLPMINK